MTQAASLTNVQSAADSLAFGARFVAEAERLGLPLSVSQSERLRRASRGQVMSAVQKRLASTNPELIRLLGRRGPEALARELSLSSSSEPGPVSRAMDVFDTMQLLELLADAVEGAASAIELS